MSGVADCTDPHCIDAYITKAIVDDNAGTMQSPSAVISRIGTPELVTARKHTQ